MLLMAREKTLLFPLGEVAFDPGAPRLARRKRHITHGDQRLSKPDPPSRGQRFAELEQLNGQALVGPNRSALPRRWPEDRRASANRDC